MKNIEIITAQNVVLQYELAGLQDRVLAFLLDMVCLVFFLSILSAFGFAILSGSETATAVFSIFLSCIFIFYSLAFEILNKGQSIGKMALRIQVIKVAGGQATFSDYAARWVFRLIDIYFSMGAIASILIVSSAKGQRIGDVVANTAVVKLAPKMNLDLQGLLAIHQTNVYKPQYQQARKLHEEDALLIKTALDRYRKFHNDAHAEAIDLLAQRIQAVLDIERIPAGDHTRFLQTILQDYVVLTR
jgi:uncharacterized RDD family membrane protein YckC